MQAQVPQNLRVPYTQSIVQGQRKAGCGVALFWLWAAAIRIGHQGIPHSCLSWDWERAFRLLRARSMESRKTEGKDMSHALSLIGSKRFFLDREDPSPHKEGCIYGLRDLWLYLRKYSDWNPGCLFLHPRDDYAHLPSRLWSLLPKATSGSYLGLEPIPDKGLFKTGISCWTRLASALAQMLLFPSLYNFTTGFNTGGQGYSFHHKDIWRFHLRLTVFYHQLDN